MHFKNYPHDTQTCRMQIESSKLNNKIVQNIN